MDQVGQSERLPERLAPELEAEFPGLAAPGYYVTSARTDEYNCVAYAAGDTTRYWDCGALPLPGYYWPDRARHGSDIDALIGCFESIGFETCVDGRLALGYEKVALYDNGQEWTHVAKQLSDGYWSSKLGSCEDIRHKTPYALCGSVYGQVARFMRRKTGVVVNGQKTEEQ